MIEFFQQVANGLMIGSTYAIVALGFGLVFSVMRVINFAHPEIFVVGIYTTYVLVVKVWGVGTGLPPLAGIGLFLAVLAVAAAVTGLAGLVLERVVIRPLRGTYLLIPFIATAGISISIQAAIQRVFGPDPLRIPALVPFGTFEVAGVNVTRMQAATFVIAVALMVVLRYFMRRTRWGRATRAVAEGPDMAAACGVNVDRVYQMAVGIASAMAGVAGVTIGLLYATATPFIGGIFGLKSFVCMLVAGNRHLEGIMVVGLVLGVMEALVTGYLTSTLRDAVAFGLLLTVLFFRPKGFFGSYEG
jgi:branched-chain amino acid transport system permease protein